MTRGWKPDECYWTVHARGDIWGREAIDLEVDPPPDLAIEVEVSKSLLNKMAIYAAPWVSRGLAA